MTVNMKRLSRYQEKKTIIIIPIDIVGKRCYNVTTELIIYRRGLS